MEKYMLPLVILSGQPSRKVDYFAWVIQASGGAAALDSSIEVSESLRENVHNLSICRFSRRGTWNEIKYLSCCNRLRLNRGNQS